MPGVFGGGGGMNRLSVSVSGGRTSAYMAKWILDNQKAVADYLGCRTQLDLLFTFANTGMEHDDTLRFMDAVDRELLGGQVVWLEAVVQHGSRTGSGHRVTDFERAYRNTQWADPLHPFHAVILKYGVPNVTWQPCNREMKLNAMRSYRKSIGWARGSYATAIGIRADEQRRVSCGATKEAIIYPLVYLTPTDKDDVLDYFSDMHWDLEIPEHLGNCVTCFKKSLNKLSLVHAGNPDFFEFNRYMEQEYGFVGPEFEKHGITNPRVFFRGNQSTVNIIDAFSGACNAGTEVRYSAVDGGCSESCEVYPTDEGA